MALIGRRICHRPDSIIECFNSDSRRPAGAAPATSATAVSTAAALAASTTASATEATATASKTSAATISTDAAAAAFAASTTTSAAEATATASKTSAATDAAAFAASTATSAAETTAATSATASSAKTVATEAGVDDCKPESSADFVAIYLRDNVEWDGAGISKRPVDLHGHSAVRGTAVWLSRSLAGGCADSCGEAAYVWNRHDAIGRHCRCRHRALGLTVSAKARLIERASSNWRQHRIDVHRQWILTEPAIGFGYRSYDPDGNANDGF